MNNVVLIGNLTRDPELKYTQQGTSVCNFTLAVTRPFARDKTDFFSCQAWGKVGENVAQYLQKGSQAAVQGHIQIDVVETETGNRYYTKINANQVEFLSRAKRFDDGNEFEIKDVKFERVEDDSESDIPF